MKPSYKILMIAAGIIGLAPSSFAANMPNTVIHQTAVNTVSGKTTIAHRTILLGTGDASDCHITNTIGYGLFTIPMKEIVIDGNDLAAKAGLNFTCGQEQYKTLTRKALGKPFNLTHDGNTYTGATPNQDSISI
jgi:hypothetical protein